MKKLLTLVLGICLVSASYAATNDYYINDDAVETVLNQGMQFDFTANDLEMNNIMGIAGVEAANPNAWVAFALAFVVGQLGIHRVYLGGKGILILLYIITCGGIFGIVPLIDWIVLLVGAIQKDISAYVGNDSFFMWL